MSSKILSSPFRASVYHPAQQLLHPHPRNLPRRAQSPLVCTHTRMAPFTLFIAPVACATPEPAPRRTCTRRALLHALPALPLALRAVAAAADGEAPSATTDARGRVTGDVTLADFSQMLERGEVQGVWFYGSMNDYCAFETKDGRFLHVGQGYPVESPRSPESPLQIAAKVRNCGVPYWLQPVDRAFLRR